MTNKFNNQTYFKMGTGFDDPFTRVPNSILDEKNISAKSLGIYVKIIRFQNSTKHKIYISSLANELKEGKDAIRTAIHELMNLGYIERNILRNEKGHMNGYVYTVHAQPIEKTTTQPKSDNPKSVNPESDSTTLKKKISKKENKKKENNVVVVDEKETKLLEMYKSFKLEKRVMPHTIKLLKEYKDKFDLEVFEQVFISASEESIKKKYAYIKEVFEKLVIKNIKSLNDFEEDNKKYKENKSSIKKSSNKSNSNKTKTRFHNINQRFDKYTEDELNKILEDNQNSKFEKPSEDTKNFINKSLESEEYYNSLSDILKTIAKNHILKNSEFIPSWIK